MDLSPAAQMPVAKCQTWVGWWEQDDGTECLSLLGVYVTGTPPAWSPVILMLTLGGTLNVLGTQEQRDGH